MLAYGDALEQPTLDVIVDDYGIRSTLLLCDQAVATLVPWASVFYLMCPAGGAVMWMEDYPAALREEHAAAFSCAPDDCGYDSDYAEPAEAMAAAAGASPRTRPEWLRLV